MLPDSLNELFREAIEEVLYALGAECDRGRGVGNDKSFESFRSAGGAQAAYSAANIPGGQV